MNIQTGDNRLPAAPKRVLVIELAGLGDNVHLLPALWLVRQRWPKARLEVLVNARMTGLFALTPWVQAARPFPQPKPGVVASLAFAKQLYAERFDVVIDTKATDRSSLLSFASGAPLRIGRRPADGGPPGWAHLFTRVVEQRYYESPMYEQKWRCLQDAGFAAAPAPEFHYQIDARLRREIGIGAADERRYLHLSPCTTAAARELPVAQLAAFIDALAVRWPDRPIVLSCAPDARERERVAAIVGKLRQPPWKIFAGTLDIPSLAAIIETAAINLSGDTGSLHLAMMTNTPSVAWFRSHRGEREWIPRTGRSRVLIAPDVEPRDILTGIDSAALLTAVDTLLAGGT